jgi:hypothetical protein
MPSQPAFNGFWETIAGVLEDGERGGSRSREPRRARALLAQAWTPQIDAALFDWLPGGGSLACLPASAPWYPGDLDTRARARRQENGAFASVQSSRFHHTLE